MANGQYDQYEQLYLQQAELFEKNAVAWVRSALVHFSRVYLRILRSEVVPRQPSPQVNGTGTETVNNDASNNQQWTRDKVEIDAARQTAQHQIVTALAKEFEALASLPLPSALNIPLDNAIVNGNANSNADNVFVRREIEGQPEAPLVLGEELVEKARDEPVRAIPVYFDFLPSASTGPGHSLCANEKFNYIEDSPAGQDGNLTVNRNGKRTTRHSGQLSTPKRAQGDLQMDLLDVELEKEVDPFKVILLHLTCPQTSCKKTKFKSKSQLKKHLLLKHQIMAYQCKVKDCNGSFASNAQLMDHRKVAHRKWTEWPCPQCETILKRYSELCRHFRDNHEMGCFLCPASKCTFIATTRIKVDNHKVTHQLPSGKVEAQSDYQM